jgi:hypothetical protein
MNADISPLLPVRYIGPDDIVDNTKVLMLMMTVFVVVKSASFLMILLSITRDDGN